MSDVQITVRLGREAGLHQSVVLIGLQVFENDVAYEIRRSSRWYGSRLRGRLGRGIGWIHYNSILSQENVSAGRGQGYPPPDIWNQGFRV